MDKLKQIEAFVGAVDTGSLARAALVADWAQACLANPKEGLILAHDRGDVAELNRLARAEMEQAGLLGAERLAAHGRSGLPVTGSSAAATTTARRSTSATAPAAASKQPMPRAARSRWRPRMAAGSCSRPTTSSTPTTGTPRPGTSRRG